MSQNLQVHAVSAFKDNYLWVGRTKLGFTFVVDPGDSAPIFEFLAQRQWSLDLILNTHHHPDHVGGNLELQAHYQCPIWGGEKDSARLPGITRGLAANERIHLGECEARVLLVPGHTTGHVAYHFAEESLLFVGDTLFSLGCGRLFEGTPEQMWSSLKTLAALPEDTLVYCAHEYTLANLEFSLGMLQALGLDWPTLRERGEFIRAQRTQGEATVPFRLGDEKLTNLFLNCDRVDLQTALKAPAHGDLESFARLRRLKDLWPKIDI